MVNGVLLCVVLQALAPEVGSRLVQRRGTALALPMLSHLANDISHASVQPAAHKRRAHVVRDFQSFLRRAGFDAPLEKAQPYHIRLFLTERAALRGREPRSHLQRRLRDALRAKPAVAASPVGELSDQLRLRWTVSDTVRKEISDLARFYAGLYGERPFDPSLRKGNPVYSVEVSNFLTGYRKLQQSVAHVSMPAVELSLQEVCTVLNFVRGRAAGMPLGDKQRLWDMQMAAAILCAFILGDREVDLEDRPIDLIMCTAEGWRVYWVNDKSALLSGKRVIKCRNIELNKEVPELCLITAVWDLLCEYREGNVSKWNEGYIFKALRWGRLYDVDDHMSSDVLQKRFKAIAREIGGIPEEFSGCRRGGFQHQWYEVHCSEEELREMGRWNSVAVMGRYLRRMREERT